MSRHPDFKTLEASRPAFPSGSTFSFTQTPNPSWAPGSGATSSDWKDHKTVSIDPCSPGRAPVDNYKLLISGIIPRPIGFISTIGKNGERNLAPMSYTNIVNHDPPILTVGFSAGTGPKDTARHLLDTKECTVNVISEWFVEAANYCSINAPLEISEWDLSGLTPVSSDLVKPPRVAESAFSIECKLVTHHDWTSKVSGKHSGTLVILEGVRFHVREDAINEQRNLIDPGVLKPVSRLGGITFGRTTEAYELLRPDIKKEAEVSEHVKKIVSRAAEKEE